MNRRFFLAATLTVLAQTPFAALADIESDIVRRLRADGYRQIQVTRTMLGRLRITAVGRGGTREIILNPQTGEVLRDVYIAADGSTTPTTLADEGTGTGGGTGTDDGTGTGGTGDDPDDDGSDDSDDGSDDDSDDSSDDSEDDDSDDSDDGGDDDDGED